MESGQRVILFLNRRPRPSDFIEPEAPKSPFALVPSGVYLIDEYQHVHEYDQRESTADPYTAEGYSFWRKSAPSRDQDLALPSLEDVTSRIAASLKPIEPLRPLLEKVAARDDAPALMNFLDARSRSGNVCGLDAIVDRLTDQLRSLKDPAIALASYSILRDLNTFRLFVKPNPGANIPGDTGVHYLVRTLADSSETLALRTAAAEILLDLSRYWTESQTEPSGPNPAFNNWLRGSVDEIRPTAQAIFDDESQDELLRSLCLGLMPLDQAASIADVRRVYARTQSEQLRFAIEEAFLNRDDVFYQDLNPSGGPIVSIVAAARTNDCIKSTEDHVVFVEKHHLRTDLHDPSTALGIPRFVLTNLQTGQRFLPKINQLLGWRTMQQGEMRFEFNRPLDLPAGDCTITPEYTRNGEVISAGHPLRIVISDTPTGKKLSLKQQN